ncbi:hypothetical protein TWF679_006211 [Orbilia oligospora]|uniref:Uncharacterized protein n=1 Tax=Orbilia oligospora TaxID=2813651 RepID=A0A8H8UP89_ORBOL|nr:hypothetical protein TWF679_006211 [Orbilia oligospora]
MYEHYRDLSHYPVPDSTPLDGLALIAKGNVILFTSTVDIDFFESTVDTRDYKYLEIKALFTPNNPKSSTCADTDFSKSTVNKTFLKTMIAKQVKMEYGIL